MDQVDIDEEVDFFPAPPPYRPPETRAFAETVGTAEILEFHPASPGNESSSQEA